MQCWPQPTPHLPLSLASFGKQTEHSPVHWLLFAHSPPHEQSHPPQVLSAKQTIQAPGSTDREQLLLVAHVLPQKLSGGGVEVEEGNAAEPVFAAATTKASARLTACIFRSALPAGAGDRQLGRGAAPADAGCDPKSVASARPAHIARISRL